MPGKVCILVLKRGREPGTALPEAADSGGYGSGLRVGI